MSTLTSQVSLKIAAIFANALDVGSVEYPVSLGHTTNLANGTGADQANQIFTDTRTLSASATEDLDLAGGLSDAFGSTITFTKIKALVVSASSGNTNNVLVGGASSAQFDTLFGDASDIVVVRPGGMVAFVAPDSTAYAVTATTADLLKIANSAGSTAVTYTITIIGTV